MMSPVSRKRTPLRAPFVRGCRENPPRPLDPFYGWVRKRPPRPSHMQSPCRRRRGQAFWRPLPRGAAPFPRRLHPTATCRRSSDPGRCSFARAGALPRAPRRLLLLDCDTDARLLLSPGGEVSRVAALRAQKRKRGIPARVRWWRLRVPGMPDQGSPRARSAFFRPGQQ